jgi:hypothetical protein
MHRMVGGIASIVTATHSTRQLKSSDVAGAPLVDLVTFGSQCSTRSPLEPQITAHRASASSNTLSVVVLNIGLATLRP